MGQKIDNFMIKFNELLFERFGCDKLLHMTIAALLISMVAPFGILPMSIALGIVSVCIFLKDYVFDQESDIMDVVWSEVGCVVLYVYHLLLSYSQA